MYILQLYSTNSLNTAYLGQVIIKIRQLKILLRVQWTRLVVRELMMLFIAKINTEFEYAKKCLWLNFTCLKGLREDRHTCT